MPRLLPEDASLNSRALKWLLSAAVGAALASFAGLIGRWSDDPALGWTLAAAAFGLGGAASALAGAPKAEDGRVWAVVGALAALAVPALLRLIGLSYADATLLENPLGAAAPASFVLGQAVLLAAIAATALFRALRGAGSGGTAAAFVCGGAAAALATLRVEPSLLLAAAGLAALAAAEFADAPWSRLAAAPLRARAFSAAALAGLGLAWFAPNLLRDVWMARLYAAYPGGRYLAAADDGARLWAAFRFSNGEAMMLRDGVAQSPDPISENMALRSLIGQRPSGRSRVLLLVEPPEPDAAFAAQEIGAVVSIDDGSRAQAAVLTALGGGAGWRSSLTAPPRGTKPEMAFVFLPRPAGADLGRLAGAAALKALRARLADDGVAGFLLPPGASPGTVDAVSRAAAAAFGGARVADLPKGVLVLAGAAAIETDPETLVGRLALSLKLAEIQGRWTLAKNVLWRAAPSTK